MASNHKVPSNLSKAGAGYQDMRAFTKFMGSSSMSNTHTSNRSPFKTGGKKKKQRPEENHIY